MKIWSAIFLALAAGLGSALAEDVKLANGSILRNVTINWADDTGVSITPAGGAAPAMKYPWKSIHPDDRPYVHAIATAVAEGQQKEKEIKQSAVFVALEVISVEEKGILARLAKAVPSLASPDPDHPEYTHEPWDDHPVFIFLADTSGLSAGKKGLQKLYPVGTYRDSGRTYRAFVTRADDAAAITAAQKK